MHGCRFHALRTMRASNLPSQYALIRLWGMVDATEKPPQTIAAALQWAWLGDKSPIRTHGIGLPILCKNMRNMLNMRV